MKLKLEKQTLVSLTQSEMNQVNGGGETRSDRREGDCAHSRKYGYTGKEIDTDNDGVPDTFIPDGCQPAFDCGC